MYEIVKFTRKLQINFLRVFLKYIDFNYRTGFIISCKTHKFKSSFNTIIHKYFTTTNQILNLLFPYYYCTNYSNKTTDKTTYPQEQLQYSDLTPQNKKNVMSLLLFTVFYEMLELGDSFKRYIYQFNEAKKTEVVKALQNEVSNNMFDIKYPFVVKLNWGSVVDAFIIDIDIINGLNQDGNMYNNLVSALPDV